MTSIGHIVAPPTLVRANLLRRLRAIRAQASFLRPRFWSSYVIERDLRTPMVGGELIDGVRLVTIEKDSHSDFANLTSVSRHVGIGRMRCAQYLSNGAVATLALVSTGTHWKPAACGWMTQSNTPVPFLNARFSGGTDVCLLYQDFVLPEFRGLGLQRMLGRHRLSFATERGAKHAYGYIRRANTPSLRNAIDFHPVAIVHNIRSGNWAAAAVRALGHRKCSQLPFLHWPDRQSFIITPRSNRRLV